MRVFIAGGAGYIGSRLVPFLEKDGHEVVVADLLWFDNFLPPSVKVLRKDVFELEEKDLWGYDAVIFLAGLSNDPMADYSPALNFISNGAAPTYLAYLAKKAGIPRYIYAGSCSVYGYTEDELTTEECEPHSVYPYGISKLKGERGVMLLNDGKFSVICLRQGTVSGWSPRMRLDLLVNAMYKDARRIGEITVNNPNIWRPLLAMSDLLAVYDAALRAPRSISGIFNVHSGNVTVGDVAKRVQQFFKKRGAEISVKVKNVPDVRNYRVSNEKARAILGINFKGTIESVLEDLHKNVGPAFDFDNKKFYNIETFKTLFPDKLFPELDVLPLSKKEKTLKKGLVSIGIPIYNGAAKMQPALESLLNQTYRDVEFVISDDASTDDTEKICREFAARDSRIRYVRQPKNLTQLPNIEFVMRESRGEYFVLGADDDWWHPQFVERLVNILKENPKYGAAIGSVRRQYADGEIKNEVLYKGELDLTHQSYAQVFDKMSSEWPTHWFCGVYRTKLIQSLMRRSFPRTKSHDRIVMCELSLATHIYSIPEILHYKTIYRQNLAERYSAQGVGKALHNPKAQSKYVLAMLARLIFSPDIPLYRKLWLYPYHLSLFVCRNRVFLREWFPRAFKLTLTAKRHARQLLARA